MFYFKELDPSFHLFLHDPMLWDFGIKWKPIFSIAHEKFQLQGQKMFSWKDTIENVSGSTPFFK